MEVSVTIPEPPECRNGFLYTVRPGDSLFLISRRYGVRLEDLVAANPQIRDPNLIYPGQRVCVPVPEAPACPNGFVYTVARGDTMFGIAQRFGVSLEALVAANPQIMDPNRIFPGQRVCVPVPQAPPCPNGFLYTVEHGDTLFRIAQKYNVCLQSLITANPQIKDPDKIFPGQKICVPTKMEMPEAPPPTPPCPPPMPMPPPMPPCPPPMPPPCPPPMPPPCAPPYPPPGPMPPPCRPSRHAHPRHEPRRYSWAPMPGTGAPGYPCAPCPYAAQPAEPCCLAGRVALRAMIEPRRAMPLGGWAYVHPPDVHRVLAVVGHPLPNPTKLGHDCRYYYAWAETAEGKTVSMRLKKCDGLWLGCHEHERDICWVRVIVTAEPKADPKHPGNKVVLASS